ncbi:hypothetical protein Taro_014840 [Colocasia esculenta]|uniref:Uncharacterized protein n=1 Tax=Colocasia esculenta TaxID=4460 RepID=A0A843URF8_COLES|nr:hypothetical protein [Colocasia esculenta]
MAAAWVKSLQCRSSAVDDVYHPKPPPLRPADDPYQEQRRRQKKNRKPGPQLLPLGCGANTSQAFRDVVALLPKHPLPRTATTKKPPPATSPALFGTPPPSPSLKEKLAKQQGKPHRQDKPAKQRRQEKGSRPKSSPSLPLAAAREPPSSLPTLTELPAGHSSHRVVEIIFSSSWSGAGSPFPGMIEMLFKVRNPPRTVARFEEYREAVRARAGPGDARCAADGNEMMRFHCAPDGPTTTPAGDPIYDAGVMCSPAASGGGIRTFAGSGGAHETVGGAAGSRRAMLVCRVIAGRIRSGSEPDEFESVSVAKGELLVFDPRAVLPCFLILYRV